MADYTADWLGSSVRGVTRVDVAATHGQAFADTVQQLATKNGPDKDRWVPVVVPQNMDGWDPLSAL